MKEQGFTAELRGYMPLIMHADNIEWADTIEAVRKEIKDQKGDWKAGDDRCPPFTWRGYVYRDLEGKHVSIPTELLGSCLRRAGATMELKKQETFKRLTQSGILFDGMDAEFFNDGKPIRVADVDGIEGKFPDHLAAAKKLGFELFVKRVVIGQSKHVRVRAMFRKWTARVGFTVIDDRLTFDILKEIWARAGRWAGLCDWRPGSPRSPGPFGTFEAKVVRA